VNDAGRSRVEERLLAYLEPVRFEDRQVLLEAKALPR